MTEPSTHTRTELAYRSSDGFYCHPFAYTDFSAVGYQDRRLATYPR